MTNDDIAHYWAQQFGLASVPLFEAEMSTPDGQHLVLLDGGSGSFALSITGEELWKRKYTADWAWSSDLPHHVSVTDKVVAVTRWDRPDADLLSRQSVESRLETFYSYLVKDRVRSTRRVVDHVLGLFRRIRSIVANSGLPDSRSVEALLAFFGHIIELDKREGLSVKEPSPFIETSAEREILEVLSRSGIEALADQVRTRDDSAQPFRLYPSLAVRHAGSEIFQEAHFELLKVPSMDLFGYAAPAEVVPVTRGGAHFTPAALARTVVEQTLAQVERLSVRNKLVVLDLSCGSGVFLQEALRALRRLQYSGELVLVGRDISPAAVSMAKFVLRHAALDWHPPGGLRIDVRQGDSLADELPLADVVLMNPPFISWPALDQHQRELMSQVLGKHLRGRSDFSMAFITRATDALAPGGAIGVLLPQSLLTLQSAEAWRKDLMERAEVRLLASLGEHGLFAHALVQVSAAVLAKPSTPRTGLEHLTAIVSTNRAASTGDALRSLRRLGPDATSEALDGSWRIFQLPRRILEHRPTWRLTSPRTETALLKLLDSGACRLGELFGVRQGVRTGHNRVFVLSEKEYRELPPKERRYFRTAIMNDSIKDGHIRPVHWVFYPYSPEGPLITSEEQLRAAVPIYFKKRLAPNEESLREKMNLTGDERVDWWALSRSRTSWAFDTSPRIISKYFGGAGGFAVDLDGLCIVVQGFAWFPKWISSAESRDEAPSALSAEDLVCAYAAMMNSRRFARMLELFSAHVAGGQFDLSPRYVNHIPVPNLPDVAKDERAGRLVTKLAEHGREPRVSAPDWQVSVDRLVGELYGGDFFDQV